MGILRLSLALAVLFFHDSGGLPTFIRPMNGSTAVFCFFVISGFYMQLVLATKYTRARLGKNWLLSFYASRYFRLFPAYFMTVLLTVVLAKTTHWVKLPDLFDPARGLSRLRQTIAVIGNLTMIGTNLPSVQDLITRPTWSIGVEISFYLLAPFLINAKRPVLVACATIGVILQFVTWGQHAPLLFGVHFFLYGMLLYKHRAWVCQKLAWLVDRRHAWLLSVGIVAMVFYRMPSDISIGRPDEHAHNLLDRLIYPIIVGILLPVLHETSAGNRRDYWIGQLSYPFYLLHQLALDVSDSLGLGGARKLLIVLIVCLLASALVVWLESVLVEPIRARLANRSRTAPTA